MKLLTAAVTLGVLSYFVFQAVGYFNDPLSTTLAYAYQVELGVEATGYVVRTERVLPDDDGGLLRIQRAEGERVGSGGTVAAVYADQASLDRQAEIDALAVRLEQLRYAQESLDAGTVKKLDTQIEESILNYRRCVTADRLYDAENEASELRALVLKRDYTDGGGDLADQIQEVDAQLQSLRSQAAGSVRRITAPEAGLYSGEVDGFETVLTPETLEGMTPSQLGSLTAQMEAASHVGKLILGNAWYYGAVLTAADAAMLDNLPDGSLSLRFAKGADRDFPVVLDSIGPSENGRVVAVFRGNTYLQELTLLRQQRAEILYDAVEGVRIPKTALRAERAVQNEDGSLTTASQTGVYCVVGLRARFKPVDVLYTGENFVLVRATATDEELILRPGEEIIISAKGLYDRKVLQ
ncbi:MAG: hypothetical protein HFF84_04425 [Oscillibacter sp.]|nr:hypothetical protein [Oscillibacter sp.]